MPSHSYNLRTSTNLFSASARDGSNNESREDQRERRARAALTRLQNGHENSDGASSQETPSEQPTNIPPAVTQEEESSSQPPTQDPNPNPPNESESEAAAVRLDFDNTAADSASPGEEPPNPPPENGHNDNEDDSPAHNEDENVNVAYSEEERRMDAQVIADYFDFILQDFPTEDPVEFEGQLYERQSIEGYFESIGLDFSDPSHFSVSEAWLNERPRGVIRRAPTTVIDPHTGNSIPLDFTQRRPYTEVAPRYVTILRQEVEDYEARAERREQYESNQRRARNRASRR